MSGKRKFRNIWMISITIMLFENSAADGNGGTDMKRKYQTMAALILSAALIIIGVMEGQNRQVFVKAVNICLECVGLG